MREQAKKPESTIVFSHNLFGQAFDAEFFSRTLQPIGLEKSIESNSTIVKIQGNSFRIEEITAMLIEHVREMSQKFGESTVKDCSITVPSFWTRGQRIGIISTAQAAGLNVLSLINENTAASLYYGIDRFDNETSHFVLFYNLGASYLQVTLTKYDTVTQKNKVIENIEILAQTSDTTLGGSTFDNDLTQYLAKKFEEIHGLSLVSQKKPMSRLLTQANLAKKVLSASKSTLVMVNNIYKNIDFKYTLTREELENIIAPYESRLVSPITQALKIAGLEKTDINYLEIIGGVSRIPRIQEIIKKYTEFDASTHLNGDEAMAHGAALYAANFSSVLQVKPIWLSDVNNREISVKVFEMPENVLISDGVVFNQTWKMGNFNRILVNSKKNIRVLMEDITSGTITGIGEYETSGVENIEVDDFVISLIFVIDYNGISFLYTADAEYQVPVKKVLKKEATEEEPEEEIIEEVETERKTTTIKLAYRDLEQPQILSSAGIQEIKNKLNSFKEVEKNAKALSESKNDIESYIYFVSDKTTEDVFVSVTSELQREAIGETIVLLKEWLESEEFDLASVSDVKNKKSELETLVKDPLLRESELDLRDTVVEKAKKDLKALDSELFSINETKPWVPEEDLRSAWAKITELEDWINNKITEQKSLELWQDLVFKSSDIVKKMTDITSVVGKLKRMNKPKEKVISK